MICNNCLSENLPEAQFCEKCGCKLSDSEIVSPPEEMETAGTPPNEIAASPEKTGAEMPLAEVSAQATETQPLQTVSATGGEIAPVGEEYAPLVVLGPVVVLKKAGELVVTLAMLCVMLLLVVYPVVTGPIPAIDNYAESQIMLFFLLKILFVGSGSAFPPTMLSLFFGATLLIFFALAAFFWIWNLVYIFKKKIGRHILNAAMGFSVAFAFVMFVFSALWPLLFPGFESIRALQATASISASVPDAGFFCLKISVSAILVLAVLISVLHIPYVKRKEAAPKKRPRLLFALLVALTMILTSWFFFTSLQNTAAASGASDSIFISALRHVMDSSWITGMIIGGVVLVWFVIFLAAGFSACKRVLNGVFNMADTIAFTIVSIIEIVTGIFLVATMNLNLNLSGSTGLTGFAPYIGPLLPEPLWITAAFACAVLVTLLYAVHRKARLE